MSYDMYRIQRIQIGTGFWLREMRLYLYLEVNSKQAGNSTGDGIHGRQQIPQAWLVIDKHNLGNSPVTCPYRISCRYSPGSCSELRGRGRLEWASTPDAFLYANTRHELS